MSGLSHVAGTKDYILVVAGKITAQVAGEGFLVKLCEVLAFIGDKLNSYRKSGVQTAVDLSLDVPVVAHIEVLSAFRSQVSLSSFALKFRSQVSYCPWLFCRGLATEYAMSND